MQTRISLLFFLIGLGCWTMPTTASAGRAICGVDVNLSGRCYRELRRLRRGCREQPVLCGKTFQAGEQPNTAEAKQRCRRLRRSNRALWSRGLCGIRLFSPPRTYCGAKGVEVAAACIAATQPKAATPPPVLGSQSRRSAPSAAPPVAPQPRDTNTSPAPAAAMPAQQESAARTRPAVGMARLTTPAPASSGTSWWLIFLQLSTLLLVCYLLLKRQPAKGTKDWMQSPAWEKADGQWKPPTSDNDNDNDAVLANLEQIEEQLQCWREQQDEQILQMQSPRNEMQSEADALFAYYNQLAQHIVSEVEGRKETQSEPRQRLIEARDRLHWIFRAHRELPNPSSPIDELKASSWHHIQRLLETMGYVGWESRLQSHMSTGQFSAEEFLQRKSIDQAGRFLAGEELQEYVSLRDEFVSCLERVYRSNLATLRRACTAQIEQLSHEEEQELFFRDYVMGFLLEELPLLLQDVTRRSSPDRSGALVDQFVQFIEDEIAEAKVELFPILDREMTETINTKLIYLLHAGIRLKHDRKKILREPDATVMSVGSFQADVTSEVEASIPEEFRPIRLVTSESLDQSMIEIPSHLDVDLSDDLSFDVELEDGVRASWFDAPVEEGLFGPRTAQKDSSEEITVALAPEETPSIAHPDSDSPEETAEMSMASHGPERKSQPESLPMGPLPHIENTTQSFVVAVPNTPIPRKKITREYGPEAEHHSYSPDQND